MSIDDIAFIAIPWLIIGIIMCAVIAEDDEDPETHYLVMALFWPITLAIFLIVGPFVTVFFTIKACLGMFKG